MTSCKRPWPVLLMCCVLGFNSLGIPLGLGAIFTDVMDTFGVSRATASLVQSVTNGFLFCGGIFSGHFLQWRGPRVTVIAGSVLATVGCVIAFLATHVIQVIVGIGVMAGFGLSLCYLTSHSLAGTMFHDIRSVTVGIVSASSAAGSAVYPILLRYVTNHYAVRGTFLILAAMNCQIIVCGALIGLYTPRGSPAAAEAAACKSDESEKKPETEVELDDVKNADLKSLPPDTGNGADKTTARSCCSLHAVRKALSMELFGNLRYFVLTVVGGSAFLFYPLPWMFMTDMVKSNNLSVEDGALFITILFVGNLTGRLSSGFIYRLLKSWIQIVPGVAIVMGGVTCLLFVFCESYAHFVVLSFFHGVGYGLSASTFVMSLMDIVGPDKLAVGIGYLMFCVGVFIILAGPYGGLVRDLTNSYESLFYIALGHSLILGAVFIFTTVRHQRRS